MPISLVYRRDARREGGNPLLLYGYGSYGARTEATFRSERLSLLDRGFIFAIAHVRGGEDLGRARYDGILKRAPVRLNINPVTRCVLPRLSRGGRNRNLARRESNRVETARRPCPHHVRR